MTESNGAGTARAEGPRIGRVDGSVDSDSRTFQVVLDPDAVVQLDELVTVETTLPDAKTATHYGIVTELRSQLEGADLPSDTARSMDGRLPTELVRRAEVRVLRVRPELFVAPHAGAEARKAVGQHREFALFEDQMEHGKLPLGLDLAGEPVYADMRFVDGRSGGHISISGISGVATKTSYALFLIYQLLETERGLELLGGRARAAETRVFIFNTKGEDLLHVDRGNSRFEKTEGELEKWRKLGVTEPGPFRSVRLYAPRAPGAQEPVANVRSRAPEHLRAYGWTPVAFVREQLLQYCFTATDDSKAQVGSVERHVRVQLLRRARRLEGGDSGDIILLHQVPHDTSYNLELLAKQPLGEASANEGDVVRGFADIVELLDGIVNEKDADRIREWFGRAHPNTLAAFLRRLMKIQPHIQPLVGSGLTAVSEAEGQLHVIDISTLHGDAQRFVVGTLLDRIWRNKLGSGREPLRFVVLDELNRYAPARGESPLKDLLVDIAERGRSLGVILVGAQQAASAVAPALPRNASLKAVGRLDAGEANAYRFLSVGMRERATRFLPGMMVVSQPVVPEPVPIRFPFPPFATNPDEATENEAEATTGRPGREPPPLRHPTMPPRTKRRATTKVGRSMDKVGAYEKSKEPPHLARGVHVIHPRHGPGRILHVRAYGLENRVFVEFEGCGVKRVAGHELRHA